MAVRQLVGLVFIACLAIACGDDSGPGAAPGGPGTGGPADAGDGDGDGDGDTVGDGDGDTNTGDPEDAGIDAGDAGPMFDPFDYDAAGDYMNNPDAPAPEAPDEWSCPDSLWADGHCDCGCGITDFDCARLSCITPGCTEPTCDACFTQEGTWQSCDNPTAGGEWTCSPAKQGDGTCDCGCGIPDEICNDLGCTTPGCYAGTRPTDGGGTTQICGRRHSPTFNGSSWDENEQVNIFSPANTDWSCAARKWGDGVCDCGCTAPDPDCFETGGCTDGRCFEATCERCHEDNRPYSCEAAEAGWDDDLGHATAEELCDANKHFATGDGCDCNCGGIDPDCEDGTGTGPAGATPDDACMRCTFVGQYSIPAGVSVSQGEQIGCGIPQVWITRGCEPQAYGTGDGCDCGCGTPDPDCDDKGSTDESFTNDCDVCHTYVADGMVTGFATCPSWTCTTGGSLDAFGDTQCDCGCGVLDPFCRASGLTSCTGAGCEENGACDVCNDADGNRAPCGREWRNLDGNEGGEGAACDAEAYGAGDGICDCGCGMADPDCGADEGCTEAGCNAPGCDVCSTANGAQVKCFEWTCDLAALGSGDGCDCGCGASDPDCADVEGTDCLFPGCRGSACEVCHDDLGRAVPCP